MGDVDKHGRGRPKAGGHLSAGREGFLPFGASVENGPIDTDQLQNMNGGNYSLGVESHNASYGVNTPLRRPGVSAYLPVAAFPRPGDILTASVHSKHATVQDPELHITLDSSANRAACYRCHPGSATKCLRGAMGGAIAGDGTMSMQCQSCHGNMSAVGSLARTGWLMEPNCQSCHTGTAMSNNGKIRYTTCFEARLRVEVHGFSSACRIRQPKSPPAQFPGWA